MNVRNMCDNLPQVIHSSYWERKEKFLLNEDTYKEWIVFAVENGSFYYELNENKGTAAFGDLVFCPPGLPFRRVIVTPLSFYVLRLHWYYRGEPGHGPDFMPPVGKISIANTSRLAANYTNMRKAEVLDFERQNQLRNHYMQDLWLLYCEECGSEPWTSSAEEANHLDPLMEEACSMIQKHAFHKIDLKDIASELGISPVRLTQKYKSHFGVTPIRYLTSIRLEKAKTLLLQTDMTLEQISECIGYENGYYLNRLFMKHLHVTPAKFRKMHQV